MVPADTTSPTASDSSPSSTPVTIPTAFPTDVPKPDTFESMQVMTDNGAPTGWEFYEQGRPTDSVERCIDYAAAFPASWASVAITDEAPAVRYARRFSNTDWSVGIYCVDDGGYLVQVVPVGAALLPAVDTVPTVSTTIELSDRDSTASAEPVS